jgi:hypothetical protein
MSLDGSWVTQHPDESPSGARIHPAIVSLARFLDAAGNERTSMQKLVQDRIRELGQAGQTKLEIEFPDPTYISGIIEGATIDGYKVADLKILALSATLEVIKKTITIPMFVAAASTYLFKNAIEGDNRYVLVAERGSDVAVELSVPQVTFRVA